MSNEVNEYYDECDKDYKVGWGTNKTLSLHYGFYDKNHTNHVDAVINMIRVMANMSRIAPGDRVLDAGCGIGGSSIWIAKNTGAKVTGLNINGNQIKQAEDNVRKNGLPHLVNFVKGSFTERNFPKNSFDLVWAIESVCYAERKGDFIKETYRILKPGGRIIVADGFLKGENMTQEEDREMRMWLDGWVVPNLASVNDFKEHLKEFGFRSIKFKDITKNVVPSSLRMYRIGSFFYPLTKVLEYIGLKSKIQSKGNDAALYQYKTLKKGLWTYGIFYAEK